MQLLYHALVDFENVTFSMFRNSVLFDFPRWEGVLTWMAHLITGYAHLKVELLPLYSQLNLSQDSLELLRDEMDDAIESFREDQASDRPTKIMELLLYQASYQPKVNI